MTSATTVVAPAGAPWRRPGRRAAQMRLIPAEALVSLTAQAGNKASKELKKPGNGIYLDEDVFQVDYGSGADGLKGWLAVVVVAKRAATSGVTR